MEGKEVLLEEMGSMVDKEEMDKEEEMADKGEMVKEEEMEAWEDKAGEDEMEDKEGEMVDKEEMAVQEDQAGEEETEDREEDKQALESVFNLIQIKEETEESDNSIKLQMIIMNSVSSQLAIYLSLGMESRD